MEHGKLLEASIKGLIGAGIAGLFTVAVHNFLVPARGLSWALVAVVLGAWFSGFFSEITDEIICKEDFEGDKKEEYTSIGAVFVVLGVTVYDNIVSSSLMVIGGLLFLLAAYRESDKDNVEN